MTGSATITQKDDSYYGAIVGGVINTVVSEKPISIFTTFAEVTLLIKNREKVCDQLNNLLALSQRIF
jgi:hypothetical protein